VIPLLYDSYAFITTFRACHYWGDKEECRFCDINYNLRELRRLTGDHVTAGRDQGSRQAGHRARRDGGGA
jgi:hypothetical protein